MHLRDLVLAPQRWRELLNLIYRLPEKCQWRTEFENDPERADALAAQVDDMLAPAPEGPQRPDWASYTSVDMRLDRLGYYLQELLARTPAPKGTKHPPAPLGPETLVQRRVREARDARDDAAADALEQALGF